MVMYGWIKGLFYKEEKRWNMSRVIEDGCFLYGEEEL